MFKKPISWKRLTIRFDPVLQTSHDNARKSDNALSSPFEVWCLPTCRSCWWKKWSVERMLDRINRHVDRLLRQKHYIFLENFCPRLESGSNSVACCD